MVKGLCPFAFIEDERKKPTLVVPCIVDGGYTLIQHAIVPYAAPKIAAERTNTG